VGAAQWTVLIVLTLSLGLGHAVYITTLRYNKQLSSAYVISALVFQLLLGAMLAAFVLLAVRGG